MFLPGSPKVCLKIFIKGDINLIYDYLLIVPLRENRGLQKDPWEEHTPVKSDPRVEHVLSESLFPRNMLLPENDSPGEAYSQGLSPESMSLPGSTPQKYAPLGSWTTRARRIRLLSQFPRSVLLHISSIL